MLNMAGNTVHPCPVQTVLIIHAKTMADNLNYTQFAPSYDSETLQFSQPNVTGMFYLLT